MRGRSIFWIVLFLILLGLATVIAAVLWSQLPATEPSSSPDIGSQLLSTGSSSTTQQVEPVPFWMVGLIAGFVVFQIIPLLLAFRISRAKDLTHADMREVTFLCEVPMYLGLLGSLLGVCVTQFLSGSLAAPLAYLTTISGIIFYLLGRYTIWLPLPHESNLAQHAISEDW